MAYVLAIFAVIKQDAPDQADTGGGLEQAPRVQGVAGLQVRLSSRNRGCSRTANVIEMLGERDGI